MLREIEIKILPQDIDNQSLIQEKALQQAAISPNDLRDFRILKRSIDARSKTPHFVLKVALFLGENAPPEPAILANFKAVHHAPEVIIVGAGPAGYFAALELIELGLKPIVLDRGKDVQTRRRDLRAIQQEGIVNPHSNYCFGEGGAGTYSDGKLYTRSHKRGDIEKVLRLLVEHGAASDILIDAHPHIGSNKLPKLVSNIRATIEHYGGEVIFDSHVTDFIIRNGRIKGVIVNEQIERLGEAVILATGHSARDIFYLLHKKNIGLEAKPFALGVRIEHPQDFVDKVQYHHAPRAENLPAASYRLACQVQNRGVFSFCMCPGGLVVPAATSPGEIVLNGMSMSRRDSPYANSGTVVAVEWDDLQAFHHHGVFAYLAFQQSVEQTLFAFGNGSQQAPALRLTDFVQKKLSNSLPPTSYIPQIYPAPLYELLPSFIYNRLREAVQHFGKTMRGYYTENANVIGTESRTSSPIRIPRNAETLMHPTCLGLFPCGEGAGYAGGIVSAAMDGQNVAKAVHRSLA